MDKTALKVLNRLSAEYPDYMELEVCRKDIAANHAEFKRSVAYLEELALIDLNESAMGVTEGIFGDVRITASGLDALNKSSRKVRATFIR